MDKMKEKIEHYRKIVLDILESAARPFPLQPELADLVIADNTRNHFQLLRMGWVENDRILQILMHLDIKADGKVWIQENTTELAVDDELVKRGIPHEDIVLGMHPPSYRTFSEFADS